MRIVIQSQRGAFVLCVRSVRSEDDAVGAELAPWFSHSPRFAPHLLFRPSAVRVPSASTSLRSLLNTCVASLESPRYSRRLLLLFTSAPMKRNSGRGGAGGTTTTATVVAMTISRIETLALGRRVSLCLFLAQGVAALTNSPCGSYQATQTK